MLYSLLNRERPIGIDVEVAVEEAGSLQAGVFGGVEGPGAAGAGGAVEDDVA